MQKLIKFKINKLRLSIALFFLILLFTVVVQKSLIFVYSDNFLKNLGFILTTININGNDKLNEYEIKSQIKYKNCENLFCIDLVETKIALEQKGWIRKANLKLVFPSELNIEIHEEQPKFVLDNGKTSYLLNADGKKIEEADINKSLYKNLVVISGDNVVDKINDLIEILDISPDLAKKITSAKLISNRRWTLVYSYFTTLDLPEKNPETAFRKLDMLNKRHGIISDNLKKIDLRVKDRMIIKFNINNFSFKESRV